MKIPKKKNVFFRTAFRCSDADHIPREMRFIEILGLFVLNIVFVTLTTVFIYLMIPFVFGYAFAKRKSEEQERLPSVGERDFCRTRRVDGRNYFLSMGAWAMSGIRTRHLADSDSRIRAIPASFGSMSPDTATTVLIVVCLVIGYAYIVCGKRSLRDFFRQDRGTGPFNP